MTFLQQINLFLQWHCCAPFTGQLISLSTDTIASHRHQRPLLHSKEKQWPWAQVRICPPFLFQNTMFAANNFIFFNDIAVHHPRASWYLGSQTQPWAASANALSSTAKRNWYHKCRWEFAPPFPFQITTLRANYLIFFNYIAVHHPWASWYLGPQTQSRATASNTPSSIAKGSCDHECRWEFAPPFPFLYTIFAANNFIFSITLLCSIHGPVDILAHRHNHRLPPQMP